MSQPAHRDAGPRKQFAGVKLDMGAQANGPLLCGDVSFGKTEVALRAAFRRARMLVGHDFVLNYHLGSGSTTRRFLAVLRLI